jgi:hypothetical protein
MPTSNRNTRNGGRGKRNGRRRISRKSRTGHSSRNTSIKELGIAGSMVGAAAITQGVELQDQNQQQQDDLMFVGGGANRRRKTGCANDIADHILCFLELLNTIKIYHWTTLSYPTHKATDELHGKLSTLVDSFIEIYIGHCSRGKGAGAGAGLPVFRFRTEKDACISFCECKSLDAFCKVLDDNIIHLEGLTNKLRGYTDLVNIRDEMVGALAQALYLLRLK